MNVTRSLLLSSAALALAACGSGPPPLEPKVAAVIVSEAPPPPGYVGVKALRVKSGEGCGLFGSEGSVKDGHDKLRAAAAALDATYVQVSFVQKPPINHQCKEHEYKLGGVAFRKQPPPAVAAPVIAAPVAAAPATSTSAAAAAVAAPSSERVCTPGATQACLGPGACQGAQACRDDGTGFLPCDCGPSPAPSKP